MSIPLADMTLPVPVKPAVQVSLVTLSKFRAAFLFLGLINNVIYVIILSAALDLVSADIPKGVVLFFNIFPALAVKLGWPYLVHGRVRYARRVVACTLLNCTGVVIIAFNSQLFFRMLGISMASFASGLGEMTILQLATTFGSDSVAHQAIGWFSSGTGAAGLIGAALWWFIRGLGVRTGLGLSSIIPFGFAFSYFLLLPKKSALVGQSYAQLATDDDTESESEDETITVAKPTQLTTKDKLSIAKPLFIPFMLPLFLVYFAEYTINQGVSPNLVYPVPSAEAFSSRFVKKLSDYYPLWQLVYQTFVFFARSSTALFRLPALPKRYLYIPSLLQVGLLLTTSLEAAHGLLQAITGSLILATIFCCIACEGLFGGYSYVSVFSCLGQQEDGDGDSDLAKETSAFRIACVGFADTSGILAASLLSMWLEPTLCKIQVDRGKLLCRLVGQVV